MALVTEPTIIFPENTVSQDEMVQVLENLFPYHPKWDTIERMIRNTEVENRHLLSPINQVVTHPGFEFRNNLYKDEGLKMSVDATQKALDKQNMSPQDIDLIIVVSCTGFLMPSLTSYIISSMDFRPETKQLPVIQLGCAAGAWAINRAYEYLKAYPDQNVLLVSVEFSSLLFQPNDQKISSLISDCLFGDAVSASIIKGTPETGDEGYHIDGITSYVKKNTDHYIKYDVKSTGFHFDLDKMVMHSIKDVAPIMEKFIDGNSSKKVNELDFHIFHTGGKKIMDELVSNLNLDEATIGFSRKSLKNHGNIASGVVLDVLKEEFSSNTKKDGDKGIMAAFGPGFTAEINYGTWIQN
ncbi:type III polyketide synthase [Aquimarina sp. RZ0]|uniref:type III polyketide synthase n=1 Tax=Aquimarina sp. RZ0 TaxID=2607730 RepID=UPI0011F36992|nr:type III polyketide synthase [Aquimarina sp. RZ0]KAA1242635.1 type III polyketide synthase [Aquimarina sp. RZ0]